MSARVGIDLVSVDAVRDSLSDHGEHYLRRVYSDREVADCHTSAGSDGEPRQTEGRCEDRRSGARIDPARLAARFAAKEAAFKAIGVGDEAVSWTDVEVVRARGGAVRLALRGSAATLARRAGVKEFALSLSHGRDFAAAFVIAEVERVADR
ncbi:MAG: 4'-phosphopantetheinyl transferase superfamily protein [Solirubrobacteraceae bacterium]